MLGAKFVITSKMVKNFAIKAFFLSIFNLFLLTSTIGLPEMARVGNSEITENTENPNRYTPKSDIDTVSDIRKSDAQSTSPHMLTPKRNSTHFIHIKEQISLRINRNYGNEREIQRLEAKAPSPRSQSSSSEYSHPAPVELHDPIEIVGNNAFVSNATAQGWLGDGTAGNPYVISGLNISNYSETSIAISDTTLYFQILNCLLMSRVWNGISFTNVTNGQIANNSINDNNYYGIALRDSSNCTIINNTLNNNGVGGIDFRDSGNCSITNNTLNDNNEGISLWNSWNCTITNNTLCKDYWSGIMLSYSGNCTLTHNTLNYYSWYGIRLENSCNCTVTHNTLSEKRHGIYLWGSGNCTIAFNTISKN
ncbi:MAG: nitrous oxide reductase family maturation protein NosD, partial [Candidatus Thorarchaeota archaeon]